MVGIDLAVTGAVRGERETPFDAQLHWGEDDRLTGRAEFRVGDARDGSPDGQPDRVSVDDVHRVTELTQIAQAHAGGARTARLSEIEADLKRGAYRPNPSEIAEQILSAAEVDARLRAMLR